MELGEIPDTEESEPEPNDLLTQIQTLPEKYREVLYFYYYEEYSIREMASILHRKESTIQTQLAAARKQLRTHLEREGLRYEA